VRGRLDLGSRLLLAALFHALLCISSSSALAAPAFIDPDSVVIVLPQDGRPPQTVPIVDREGRRYLPLVSVARALGVPFSWDPYAYRGWLETDSVRTRFTFDSSLLLHGADLVQMDDAVSYDRHGVLMPIDYLAVLKEALSAGRSISWRKAEGKFVWGSSSPRFSHVRHAQVGHRSSVRLSGPRPDRSILLWSPVAGLDVLLEGVAPPAESLVVSPARGLLDVREVTGWGRGSRIHVHVDPRALGASMSYDEREGFLELAATTSIDEVDRGRLRPLRRAEMPRSAGVEGPILLSTWTDATRDPAEAAYALGDIADRIARILADTLGLEALYIADVAAPEEFAARANRARARCAVAFKLDSYGTGAGQVQVWAPLARLRWEALSQDETARSAAARLLLWSETPLLSAGASEQLAATIASHLESLLAPDVVVRGRRPSRWLEGLTMPAVLVYPALTNDPISLERLLDPMKRAEFARSIAFGISEALTLGTYEEVRL